MDYLVPHGNDVDVRLIDFFICVFIEHERTAVGVFGQLIEIIRDP